MGLAGKCTSDFKESNGGYCLLALARLLWAGIILQRALLLHQIADAPPCGSGNVPTKGGDGVGHASHETGIDMDLVVTIVAARYR